MECADLRKVYLMAIDFNLSETALVLLHFQKDVCEAGGVMAPSEPEALARFDDTIAKTKAVLNAARVAQIPILYSAFGRPPDGEFANQFGRLFRWVVDAGGCIEGQPGHGFIERLLPSGGEVVTRGAGISAFVGSTFAQELARNGIKTLLVTGITTHWAVEGTVRDGADRGYDCVVLTDCVASASESTHDGSLERLGFIARLTSSADVTERFLAD